MAEPAGPLRRHLPEDPTHAGQVMLSRLCRLVLAVRLVLLLVGLGTVGTRDLWLLLALAACAVATLAALLGWPHEARPFVSMPVGLGLDLTGLVVVLVATGPADSLVAAACSAAALAGLVLRWHGAVAGGVVLAVALLAAGRLHPGDPPGGGEPGGTPWAWQWEGWQHLVLVLVFAGIGAVVRLTLDQQVASSHRHLVARAAASAAAEREELGRRLHDHLAKDLVALQLLADQVSEAVRAGEPAAARLATLASIAAGEAVAASRHLVRRQREGLRLAALPELVARTVEDWGADTGIDVALAVDETVDVPLGVSSALESVLGEALENVRRHSRARHVRVRLGVAGENVVLEVADDGVGLPRGARLADLVGRGSFGVLGMHERMAAVGGRLEILPDPGAGTVVRAVAGPVTAPATGGHDEPREVTACASSWSTTTTS